MGRQWNTIIESLGPLSGGTMSINANLTEIEALLTTLQADVADGITVSSGTVNVGNNNFQIKSVTVNDGSISITAPNTGSFRLFVPTGGTATLNNIFGATPSWIVAYSESVTFISDSGSEVPYFHDGSGWVLNDFTTPAGTLPLSGTKFVTNLEETKTISLANGFSATQTDSPLVTAGAVFSDSVIRPTRGSTTIGTLTAGTTNGTLFAASSTRNYLLIQCTSGTAFIDTNGTATASNGIQLSSGQGITFEGSFIPTGAISAITSTGTARLIGRQG
jgi:hypothetical protein